MPHSDHQKVGLLLLSVSLLCGLLMFFILPDPAQAEPGLSSREPFRYYAETGHNLSGPFLDFYDTHGGSDMFGLPLTEVITDTASGIPVQYFERARFEMRPDAPPESAVVLSDLGTALLKEKPHVPFDTVAHTRSVSQTVALPGGGTRFMIDREYLLGGPLGEFWNTQGGLDLFGPPISEPMLEEVDGKLRLVHYFKHVRLEYHTSTEGEPGGARLGMIGREYLAQNPLPEELLAPAEPVVKLGEASTPYYGEQSPDGQNVLLAARLLDGQVVAPGESMSFLDTVGDITPEAGFVDGLGIVSGEIVPVVGGGICQVSSALYEAALKSGLPVLERHNHSYLLSFFAAQPGIEAAVFVDGSFRQDLRWRNNSPHPVYVSATRDPAARVVRVALWGVSDGRTVKLVPEVQNTYEAEETWTLDEDMAEDTFEEHIPGIPGMNVGVWRQVVDADGEVMSEEWITTNYAARGAVFHHGPGGNPNELDEDEESNAEDDESSEGDKEGSEEDDATHTKDTVVPGASLQDDPLFVTPEPTPAPEEPSPAPEEPAPAPEEPTPSPAPEEPAPAPEEPAPAPEEPALPPDLVPPDTGSLE